MSLEIDHWFGREAWLLLMNRLMTRDLGLREDASVSSLPSHDVIGVDGVVEIWR